jgi:hypothetical protein
LPSWLVRRPLSASSYSSRFKNKSRSRSCFLVVVVRNSLKMCVNFFLLFLPPYFLPNVIAIYKYLAQFTTFSKNAHNTRTTTNCPQLTPFLHADAAVKKVKH